MSRFYVDPIYKRTLPVKRLRHLIKKAYLIPPSIKQDLKEIIEGFGEFYNKEEITFNVLATLYFWEILKHFQKKSVDVYEKLIKNITNDLVPTTNTLLGLTKPTEHDIYKNPLFNRINANPTKTTLYTTFILQAEQQAKKPDTLEGIPYSVLDLLIDMAIYLGILSHRAYRDFNTIPLTVFDRPLEYLMFFKILSKEQKFTLQDIVPKFYFREVKRAYLYYDNVLKLARFINSKKRAKKYLRILHKRLGLYKRKKRKWII